MSAEVAINRPCEKQFHYLYRIERQAKYVKMIHHTRVDFCVDFSLQIMNGFPPPSQDPTTVKLYTIFIQIPSTFLCRLILFVFYDFQIPDFFPKLETAGQALQVRSANLKVQCCAATCACKTLEQQQQQQQTTTTTTTSFQEPFLQRYTQSSWIDITVATSETLPTT